MCGILGCIYNNDNNFLGDFDNKKFDTALSLMNHRGPDNKSIIDLNGAKFGHVRLSIIDLSNSSSQPFFSNDKRYCIIYNGEIFNFLELRNELKLLGVTFLTESDTEVLLNSYIYWGEECLKKLNGMFAFVIFDSYKKLYFAARDNFGIKPLYYTFTDYGIIFSSEIKPLLIYIEKVSINYSYLKSFYTESCCDYGENTLINEIKQIGAGSFLISNKENKQTKWFDLDSEVLEILNSYSDSEINENYFNSLKESIRIRLRSDVPVAVTLSGGIDSATVYSLSSKINNKPPIAFSIANIKEDASMCSADSEYEAASSIVKKYNGRLVGVNPPLNYTKDIIYESLFRQEFPSWSLSHILYDETYKIISKEGIKVLLEGHGNDEILGGYPVHISTCVNSLIRKKKFKSAFKAAKIYEKTLSDIYYKKKYKANFIFWGNMFASLKNILINYRYKRSWDYKIFGQEFKVDIFKNKKLTLLQNVLIDLVKRSIVPTVLRTFDRSTMNASIEMRPPFMDPNVVIYSLALQDIERIGEYGQKNILRNYMKNDLPEEIISNKIKRGFTADIRDICNGISFDEIDKLLNEYSKLLNINSNEFINCFKEFKKTNDWLLASTLNKGISILIWCDLFIGGKWKNYI